MTLTDQDIAPIRETLPILKRVTYFNHGSIAPLSTRVVSAMNKVINAQSGGTLGRSIWRATIAPLRERAAQLVNADFEEIAILRNTVEGISTVAAGVDWKPGDNVLCNDLEFPANVYPWWNLKERFGVETRMIPHRNRKILVDDIIEAADDRTRLVTVSLVQFFHGYRVDLDRLGAFCRENNILLHVDAIQAVGPLVVDVKRSKVDFLACGGHKWLLGPIGVGFLYIRRDLIPELWASEPGHLGVKQNISQYRDYTLTFRNSGEKFEGGVHNYIGAAGLGESLKMYLEVGPCEISDRILHLTDMLSEGIEAKGFRLISHRGNEEKSGIVAFDHEHESSETIYHRLLDAGIFVTISEGAIRVAPHFHNTTTEIERFIDTLQGPPVLRT